MFYIPKSVLEYPDFKRHLVKSTWIGNILISLVLAVVYPQGVMHFVMGAVLGHLYLKSLFLFVEAPRRKLAIFLSIIRMVTVSFLIVWLGQFKLLETCVVFSGFLSYKLVLILEFVRRSIGINLNSGK